MKRILWARLTVVAMPLMVTGCIEDNDPVVNPPPPPPNISIQTKDDADNAFKNMVQVCNKYIPVGGGSKAAALMSAMGGGGGQDCGDSVVQAMLMTQAMKAESGDANFNSEKYFQERVMYEMRDLAKDLKSEMKSMNDATKLELMGTFSSWWSSVQSRAGSSDRQQFAIRLGDSGGSVRNGAASASASRYSGPVTRSPSTGTPQSSRPIPTGVGTGTSMSAGTSTASQGSPSPRVSYADNGKAALAAGQEIRRAIAQRQEAQLGKLDSIGRDAFLSSPEVRGAKPQQDLLSLTRGIFAQGVPNTKPQSPRVAVPEP